MTPAEVLRKWQKRLLARREPVAAEWLASDVGELCAELAAALESPPAKWDGWTECSDVLPDVGARVLAYHPDWGVSTGQRVCRAGGVAGDWAGSDIATHWRPLPEGP